ncbi:MAG TPA: tetratricopeptide repeat protein [Burkholderiales bacterium]
MRAWLAQDGYAPYDLRELLADPLRARVAELVATRGDVATLLQLLTELLGRAAPPAVDRMLLAEALLTRGSFEQAHQTLAEVAAVPGPMGARAAGLLAEALYQRGEFAAAAPLIEAAVAQAPDAPAALLIRGMLLDCNGDAQAALRQFQRAVAINPASVQARVAMAMGWLRLGDLRRGFGDWVTAEVLAGEYRRDSMRPPWDGRPLHGDRVLILSSNGYGDTMQLLRFAGRLREREPQARLCIQVRPPLARLAGDTGWFERVHVGKIETDDFDWQVTLTHLPLLLDLEMQEVGCARPYLRIPPAMLTQAAGWLPPRAAGRLRVGLRWRGDARLEGRRNVPFDCLLPLFKVAGVDWVALTEDAAEMEAYPGHPLINVAHHLADFSATGGLLAQLDLVISADTSVAHLAGALNLPVWLLARPDPEWRWGRDGAVTPWYESMRIFRHGGGFDWAAMIAEVAAALRERAARGPAL